MPKVDIIHLWKDALQLCSSLVLYVRILLWGGILWGWHVYLLVSWFCPFIHILVDRLSFKV